MKTCMAIEDIEKELAKNKDNIFFEYNFNNSKAKIKLFLYSGNDKIQKTDELYKLLIKNKKYYVINSLKSFFKEIEFSPKFYVDVNGNVLIKYLETYKGLKEFKEKLINYVGKNNIEAFIFKDNIIKDNMDTFVDISFGFLRMIIENVNETYLVFHYDSAYTKELLQEITTDKMLFLNHKMFKKKLTNKDVFICDILKNMSFSVWSIFEFLILDADTTSNYIMAYAFKHISKERIGKIKIILEEDRYNINSDLNLTTKEGKIIKNIAYTINNDNFSSILDTNDIYLKLRQKLIEYIKFKFIKQNNENIFLDNIFFIIDTEDKMILEYFINYIEKIKKELQKITDLEIIDIDKKVEKLFKEKNFTTLFAKIN